MNDKFEWAIQALAQSSKIQLELFPDFVNVADELALIWEEALDETEWAEFEKDVQTSIKILDDYMGSISGPLHLRLWVNDAVTNCIEWAKMRQMAGDVIIKLHWEKYPPQRPSWAIYV